MTMKQGSADDPFAEDPDDCECEPDEDDESAEAEPEPLGGPQRPRPRITSRSQPPTPSERRGSLPYIHSRDGVKDKRTQRPVFLRDHIEKGIDELVSEMEDEFGGDVYKTDVTEAAMAIAQEHPELVLAKLEEWGYGWD
jgi:hypothetical protein